MPHPDFQAGWLVLKSSAGERAWSLAEGSEPRNKLILMDLWNKSIGSSKGGQSPFGRRAKPEKGRQRDHRASVGRGKLCFPL